MDTYISEYYDSEVPMTEQEVEILLRLYEKVADAHGFSPEVVDPIVLEETNALDHVLYHAIEFGHEFPEYELLTHIFEEVNA